MRKTVLRLVGKQWFEMTVDLDMGTLVINGAGGPSLSKHAARRAARKYWVEHYEANTYYMQRLARQQRTEIPNAGVAAKITRLTNGPLYGLDVYKTVKGRACIRGMLGRSEISRFFPDAPLEWSRNNAKLMCIHRKDIDMEGRTATTTRCPKCNHATGREYVKWQLPDEVKSWFMGL